MPISVAGVEIASLLVVFSLMSPSPNARAQESPQPPPPIEQLYKMPVVYSIPGMDKAQVRPGIVYKTVEGPQGKTELKLDWYAPADAKLGKDYPAVILISGGGIEGAPYDWRDAGVYESYGRILAVSSFVAIAFTKRYARGLEGTARGVEDLRDLVAYVRGHANELSVDRERVAFWAFSGGGLLLAPVLAESPSYARAVVCFYCVTDVTLPGMSEEVRAKARDTLSAVEQVRKGGHKFPPVFIGRAGQDSPDLNRTIDTFVAAALEKNLSIEVMNHPQGRHGFDIIDPNDRSREIIRRVLEFLRVNLAP